jgi:hypothetical protein
MIPQEMIVGKNYFCEYSVKINPEAVPMLAGLDIPAATMCGVGQILQRDLENKCCVVVDLNNLQKHIVSFDSLTNIQEVD